MENNSYMKTEDITIEDMLKDIRDNIDIIAAFHPSNEYEILERLSEKITDILAELKQKGGV